VLKVNALPIFVDIDPATYNIDPDAVEAAITPRTKAVIAVHFAGQPADMDRLIAIKARHGVRIIEDAAHAHGAIWRDRHVGAVGDLGCWSFQASKNMTAGEGGMVTTNDPHLAERAWALHNCGRTPDGPWYEHGILGGNYRLTEFQSALLLTQLGRLPTDLARREAAAEYLDGALAAIPGLRPVDRDPRATRHAYHLYMFRYDRAAFDGLSRARFIEALRAEGIPASPGYPAPLNLQPIFVNRAFDTRATGYDPDYPPTQFERLDLPATTQVCGETIWLTQNLLLGTPGDLADIVTAADKIRRGAPDLRESA
jgi:dTDP-4-amino-4,6-dideoxygalactose transaminase